jgi:hypothetical protein
MYNLVLTNGNFLTNIIYKRMLIGPYIHIATSQREVEFLATQIGYDFRSGVSLNYSKNISNIYHKLYLVIINLQIYMSTKM